MKAGTRGVCRHCEGSLIWIKPFTQSGEGTWEPFVDDPRWLHMHPDAKASNAERNIIVDQKYGELGLGCPTKEGTQPGRMGQPREYCTELKGEWPKVVCNKPVVDPEIMMCGVHIKRYQEDKDRMEKTRTDRDFRAAMQEGLNEVCIRLERNWNIKVRGQYLNYAERASAEINPFELEALLISITGVGGLNTEAQEEQEVA